MNRVRTASEPGVNPQAPPDASSQPTGAFTRRARRLYAAAALVALAVMCARIVSTYAVFTQTYDEPFHIACGMEWLDKGMYRYEENTPLGRIAAAMGPWLAGARSQVLADAFLEGNTILGSGATYTRNLALARFGELPFVVLAGAGIWVWARRYYGYRSAFFSVLIFSMLPPVLAHGSLAGTDMSITATCPWAIYAWLRFLEQPNTKRSLWLGLWSGLALIAKYTSLVFLGAGFVLILIVWLSCTGQWKSAGLQNAWRALRLIAPAIAVACLIVWACFRFTFAPLFTVDELARRKGDFSPLMTDPGPVHALVTTVPVPAGLYFRGIGQVVRQNKIGHWSFLLGQRSDRGWWYFFPVVLGLKTPLGFLALALAGAVVLLKRLRRDADWVAPAPVLFALTILLSCMPSHINFGVRHVLPIYPALAITAGAFVSHVFARRGRALALIAMACVIWSCASSLAAHPDYLAYFNEMGARHPEHFLVDSDLDWGQDLGRLCTRLRARRAPSVTLSYFGTADLSRFDLPPTRRVSCEGQPEGYVAVSVTMLYLHGPLWSGCPQRYGQLANTRPLERVGKSIFLYYFAPVPSSANKR